MSANPHPDDGVAAPLTDSTVLLIYSNRPDIGIAAKFLEMEGWVSWISLK